LSISIKTDPPSTSHPNSFSFFKIKEKKKDYYLLYGVLKIGRTEAFKKAFAFFEAHL